MDGAFHGRKDILTLIKRRVADLREGYRQNMALLGSQHVGKSAILRQFLSDLDDEMIIPVYLDLEGRDIYYFSSKLIRSLLYYFSSSKGLPSIESLPELLLSLDGHIPLTVARAREAVLLLERNRLSDAYDVLLSLPEVFSLETGLNCLIILDEFQVLDDFGVSDVFRRLADRITAQKKTLYLVSSSYQELAKRILSEKLTLLFGNFEVISVESFDLRQSHEFIAVRMGNINLGLQLKNFLADFTGGQPLYLDILLHELINLAAIYKQQEVYSPLLTQAVENMVFNRWGVLSRHFELAISKVTSGKANRLVSDLLIALSDGCYRVKDLVNYIGAVKPAILTQKLNFLIDEDVVERNGSHFHIKDKLFRYWIKYVFLKRVRSIELEPGRLTRDFKEEIIRGISDFQTTSRKDLLLRVTELLQCFDNDCLDLQGRKYRIPAFKDVKPLKFRQNGGSFCDVLQAETSSGSWFLVLRKDPLSEIDINAVTQEVDNMGLKPQRCVIVSLAQLDDGAKLRALEERMWVWNEPELNSLMNLFGKPHIIA